MNVAQETLGFRRAGLSPALSLLMSAFALPIPPAALSSHLHRPTERSPTIHALLSTHCPRLAPAAAFVSWRRRAKPCIEVQRADHPPHSCNAFKGTRESLASVHSLSPVTSSAQDDSTSELLRFL